MSARKCCGVLPDGRQLIAAAPPGEVPYARALLYEHRLTSTGAPASWALHNVAVLGDIALAKELLVEALPTGWLQVMGWPDTAHYEPGADTPWARALEGLHARAVAEWVRWSVRLATAEEAYAIVDALLPWSVSIYRQEARTVPYTQEDGIASTRIELVRCDDVLHYERELHPAIPLVRWYRNAAWKVADWAGRRWFADTEVGAEEYVMPGPETPRSRDEGGDVIRRYTHHASAEDALAVRSPAEDAEFGVTAPLTETVLRATEPAKELARLIEATPCPGQRPWKWVP